MLFELRTIVPKRRVRQGEPRPSSSGVRDGSNTDNGIVFRIFWGRCDGSKQQQTSTEVAVDFHRKRVEHRSTEVLFVGLGNDRGYSRTA